jgi:beta-glucanase (GH16 family)
MKVHLIFFFALFMSACGNDDGDEEITLPSNLIMQVLQDEAMAGKVSVNASADNANYLEINFGEAGESSVKMVAGKASHTYTTSGTYTIEVRAFATASAFVSETNQVTVVLEEPAVVIPSEGYSTPASYSGMTLVWQDEFDGEAVNAADWSFEEGGGGWGNNELEVYTKSNHSVKDGMLIITARKDGDNYTSTRMITKDKRTFKYGRIDIRAALPKGQGIWPALWTLGNDISTVGWPKCGEIDIMEMIGGGGREKTIYGTPHWFESDQTPHASYGGHVDLSSGTFNDKFHVFTIIWDASKITWYMDDVQYHVIDITPPALDEFHKEHFIIFNVAVGGQWPGNPDSNTKFPQNMIVDYVRVFQ